MLFRRPTAPARLLAGVLLAVATALSPVLAHAEESGASDAGGAMEEICQSPTLTLSPAETEPGRSVGVEGSCLGEGRRTLSLMVGGEPRGTVETGADGDFSTTVQAPTEPGRTVVAVVSDGQTIASAPLEVQSGGADEEPTPSATPTEEPTEKPKQDPSKDPTEEPTPTPTTDPVTSSPASERPSGSSSTAPERTRTPGGSRTSGRATPSAEPSATAAEPSAPRSTTPAAGRTTTSASPAPTTSSAAASTQAPEAEPSAPAAASSPAASASAEAVTTAPATTRTAAHGASDAGGDARGDSSARLDTDEPSSHLGLAVGAVAAIALLGTAGVTLLRRRGPRD